MIDSLIAYLLNINFIIGKNYYYKTNKYQTKYNNISLIKLIINISIQRIQHIYFFKAGLYEFTIIKNQSKPNRRINKY